MEDENVPDSVKNKCDVWSLACIILEVLVVLSGANGPELWKSFEQSMNEGQPGCAFFGNTEFKSCVVEALKDVRRDPWRRDAVTLLEEMFNFDPNLRPPSELVAEKLQTLSDACAGTQTNGSKVEMRKPVSEECNGFEEVYWHTADGDKSFDLM